jgi:hypothetical protein
MGGVRRSRISPAAFRTPRVERAGAPLNASSSTRCCESTSATTTPASPTATTATRQPKAAARPPTTIGASTQPRLPELLWALYARPSCRGWIAALKIE